MQSQVFVNTLMNLKNTGGFLDKLSDC